MRDNGLTAAQYSSLGGIDPLVAEPVLAALADAGIAAYCGSPGEPRTTETSEVDARTPDSADEPRAELDEVDRQSLHQGSSTATADVAVERDTAAKLMRAADEVSRRF